MEIEVLEKSLAYRNNYEKINTKIGHIELCLDLIQKDKYSVLRSIEIPVTKDTKYCLDVSIDMKDLTETYACEKVFKDEFILFLTRYKAKLRELEESNRIKFRDLK
jgi:hypothetical protein